MSSPPSVADQLPACKEWQAQFLALLPALQKHARYLIQRWNVSDREEAFQAIIAYAAVAFARLVQLGKWQKAFPSSLARYGLKQHEAGRLVGGSLNCRDIGSARCRLQYACTVESLEDWKEAFAETRYATPAEIAALRIDFGDWFRLLTTRNRKLVILLMNGETTQDAAAALRISAGRVSQLRNELFVNWQEFLGERIPARVEMAHQRQSQEFPSNTLEHRSVHSSP
jgi:hypothetical protein